MFFWFELLGTIFVFLLGLRTLSWHLQSWQLREYRMDRMRAWLRTEDGKKYFVPWFFPGVFPRPKKSGRIFMIVGIFLGLQVLLLFPFLQLWSEIFIITCFANSFFFCPWLPFLVVMVLFWERFIWLFVLFSVWLSAIPVGIAKKILFKRAQKILDRAPEEIIRIGITGSYGKSSTKEILVHLLQSAYGAKAVLYNPANENNEVAIARLIFNNRDFFGKKSKQTDSPRFLVVETGAYRTGEIAQVCRFLQPHYGILTGLNQQHIELFGSMEKIKEAKFELAESTQKAVYFNADNSYLQEIFADRAIAATKIPISIRALENLESQIDKTTFTIYGEDFTLPWPGKFFAHNGLLALELVRELGVPKEKLSPYLKTLPPLKRSFRLEQHSQGFSVLHDTYSANQDGVLGAIEHLKNFPGKKFFVSIPLRELGKDSAGIHQRIFEALRDVGAEVFWCKPDFSDMGYGILGDKFHRLYKHPHVLKKEIKSLKKGDVVLLESKLSGGVLKLFS